MMFCPKCGGIMIPVHSKDKMILKCSKCGFEVHATQDAIQSYSTTVKPSSESRIKTSKVSESSSKILRSLEEIEQEKEEFYEIFLELSSEESEEKESSEE
ncbi:MAG: DNA-directed RNA polymerase subunit M [Sulfolobales archaeon]